MQIENNVIVGFDKTDKHLFIPKTIVGADYEIVDLHLVGVIESIEVEEGNKHFYTQDGCLIWRDRKAILLAGEGAKIPLAESVEEIANGAFMYHYLKEVVIPSNIKRIGYNAFACTPLKKVWLNNGLESLDLYAFGCNEDLKTLTIPKSVKKLIINEILEEAPKIANCGYRDRLYRVYKDSYAHRYMENRQLKFEVVEEGFLKNPNPPIVQSVIKPSQNSTAHIFALEHGIPF